MPQYLCESVIVPIPKRNKDASCSSNYLPFAISSNLSKVLEPLILSEYENCFLSSPLQFGFKSCFSATLCTGTVQNVVSRYPNGTSVFGCFLDAFDLVDILLERGCC